MLEKIFRRKKPKAKPVNSVSFAIKETIYKVVGRDAIPSMPFAAQKAFKVATDPEADADDFVEVIESDEALAARIIKIANSVYYDRGKKSSTIQEAVNVIGLNEVRSFLNSSILANLFPSTHPLREQFWINDIATAIIAKRLAQMISPGQADLYFLAGLMHDIGKLLLVQKSPHLYEAIIEKVKTKGTNFIENELEVFPFTHCDVGKLIAKKWGFSSFLATAIGLHHHSLEELEEIEESAAQTAAVIKAADLIAHSLGLGHRQDYSLFSTYCRESLPATLNFLGVGQKTEVLLEEAKKAFDVEGEMYLELAN